MRNLHLLAAVIAILSSVPAPAQTPTKVDYPTQVKRGPFIMDSLSTLTTFAQVCAQSTVSGEPIQITRTWTAVPSQTCAANLVFADGVIQPASAATVSITGGVTSTRLTKIFDLSLGGVVALKSNISPFYPQYWGAKFDSSTDDTTAWQATMDAVNASGGGVIACQGGTSLISGQLSYNYGTYPAVSSPIIIRGTGAASQWFTASPGAGGCWLNMTFNSGANGGRLQLISPGSFQMENMVISNTSTSGGGFVKIINTNFQDRNVTYKGSKTGVSAVDIGHVWGGQTTGNANTADSQFAGYGSRAGPGDIYANMNKSDVLQGAANGIVLDTPTFTTGDGGDCAILLDGSFVTPNQTVNNLITAPVIEQTNYTNTICFKNSGNNTVMGGGEYDGSAGILLEGVASNTQNNVLVNYAHANPTDSTTSGPDSILSITGARVSWEPQGIKFCAIQGETTGTAGFIEFSLSDNSARCPLTTGPITALSGTSQFNQISSGPIAGTTANFSGLSQLLGGINTGNTGTTTDYIAATNGGTAPTIAASGGCSITSSALTHLGVIVNINAGSSPCTLTLTMAFASTHGWTGIGTNITSGVFVPQFGFATGTLAVKGNMANSDQITISGIASW